MRGEEARGAAGRGERRHGWTLAEGVPAELWHDFMMYRNHFAGGPGRSLAIASGGGVRRPVRSPRREVARRPQEQKVGGVGAEVREPADVRT